MIRACTNRIEPWARSGDPTAVTAGSIWRNYNGNTRGACRTKRIRTAPVRGKDGTRFPGQSGKYAVSGRGGCGRRSRTEFCPIVWVEIMSDVQVANIGPVRNDTSGGDHPRSSGVTGGIIPRTVYYTRVSRTGEDWPYFAVATVRRNWLVLRVALRLNPYRGRTRARRSFFFFSSLSCGPHSPRTFPSNAGERAVIAVQHRRRRALRGVRENLRPDPTMTARVRDLFKNRIDSSAVHAKVTSVHACGRNSVRVKILLPNRNIRCNRTAFGPFSNYACDCVFIPTRPLMTCKSAYACDRRAHVVGAYLHLKPAKRAGPHAP